MEMGPIFETLSTVIWLASMVFAVLIITEVERNLSCTAALLHMIDLEELSD